MAQDRFYFWRGYWDALRQLPNDETRGMFVAAMCRYAFEDTEPEFDDKMLEFAWLFIKDQIAESVEIGRAQSERGKRGGRPSKSKKTTAKTTALSGAKSGVKSGAETTAESGAESVRYGNVPSASRTSAGADALAPEAPTIKPLVTLNSHIHKTSDDGGDVDYG